MAELLYEGKRLRAFTLGVASLLAPKVASQEVQGPPTRPGASQSVTQTQPGSADMAKVWGVKAKAAPKKLQGPPTRKQHVKNIEKVIGGWKEKQDAQKAAAKEKAGLTLPSQRKKN